MKIRIKGNTLRYRLSKTDINTLTTNSYIEESINFGQNRLVYAMQSKAEGNLSASFENNKITLYMPQEMINEWSKTNRIGFEHTDNELYILAEKDFQCLDNVNEDQSDNYPNPKGDVC